MLHEGSLVAALASWLDARSRSGLWRVRIEDLDRPRNVAGAAAAILAQLDRCGLRPDGAVVYQSDRLGLYAAALRQLRQSGAAYPCACSRSDLRLAAAAGSDAPAEAELAYLGTCRNGLDGKPARSWRFAVAARAGEPALVSWHDRRLGTQTQDVARAVGDFVVERADGVIAYQLAVVVDDAEQGITDVVRGEDLADNTARQILLQRRLGLSTPRYLHLPLVLAADGRKLSKQTGARPLDLTDPLAALRRAGGVLGITAGGATIAEWLGAATAAWRGAYRSAPLDDAPAGIIAP